MPSAPVAGLPRPRSRTRRLLFALVPVTALLLGLEVVTRMFRETFYFGSYRDLRVDLMRRGYPAQPDARLGYVPKAGFAGGDNHWGTKVSIDQDGFRRNGDAPPPVGERCILAVGDSFTFGDQVDDDASWPAQLERQLGRPVKNGGVFGYSFAQTILRAEDLVARFPIDTLVVSLIYGDLDRNEYSKRYTPVPWFEIVEGALVLRNCPVVDTSMPQERSQRPWKNLLGHSALLDAVLATACRQWWIEDEKQVQVPHLIGQGGAIGNLLIERIGAFCQARGVRLLVVLQGDCYGPNGDDVRLLRHAEAHGIATLDLVAEFLAAQANEPGLGRVYFAGHMTRKGNGWAAQRIAAALLAKH